MRVVSLYREEPEGEACESRPEALFTMVEPAGAVVTEAGLTFGLTPLHLSPGPSG